MNLTVDDVFPGLRNYISENRFQRIAESLDSLLQKTLIFLPNGLPFIITGDIPAMWLRDSTWQVKPLLYSNHPDVVDLLINLSRTQVNLFLIDPYANAFNPRPNGNCWHKDFPDQSPWVFERKFELDSWASILYLARKIKETYGRIDHLDENFRKAVQTILELSIKEQNHNRNDYVFMRSNGVKHDSLSHEGKGAPISYSGMIYSAFRPSDDACQYGYLIPSNIFLMSELRKLPIDEYAMDAIAIAEDIQAGVEDYGIFEGRLAYEVDGMGNSLFIDDANVPSLLSLPYLEAMDIEDPVYQETRSFILSEENPLFFTGTTAKGIGSIHTPSGHVWPIAIAIEALTSNDPMKQLEALEVLETTDAGTNRMHESFDVDDPSIFTRPWFSWSDMTYVELVLRNSGYHA